MAALTWIEATDEIIGEGHPQKGDTKNRAGIALYTNMLVGHDSAGRHRAQDYALVGEIGTYVGDGSSSKVISLTNTTLMPKFCLLWRDSTLNPYERIDTLPTDKGYQRGQEGASLFSVLSFDAGEFTVSQSNYLTNAVTFYYLVLGIDNTASYTGTPAAGSDPTWITSSTSNLMIGDGTGTVSSGNIGNNIESAINTLFGVAHNTTTGAHTTDPYSGFGKIETGFYVGSGSGDITVSLSEDIDIKYIICLRVNTSTSVLNEVASKNETMAATDSKREIWAALITDGILTIGTGEFDVDTDYNNTTYTYYWMAIGE